MELSIDVQREGDDAVVHLAGELDISTSPDLQDVLADLTDAPRRVAVDLSDLEFIDSTGLAALLGAHKALDERGGVLELRHPSKMVVGLVQITGLDDVFEIRLSS
ncbi:STAS domain-containing protein [Nocardioides iriomotensis]|uniref:Anti-sigma factor antagonist n=1 Tax=Nocardioides iriomotensis TaxID=715784 RepID=A0A4Q5J679_9ACTN|nr:STAS domain-containing protein [Nocardioides iriomotensis]RYU13085.1 anti-sigma factor antagonist [Nocardioides iriomotensis]